jgi:hypothetical protein
LRQQREEQDQPRQTASHKRKRLLAVPPKAEVEDDGVDIDIDSILPTTRARQKLPAAAEELSITPSASSRISIVPPDRAGPPVTAMLAVEEDASTDALRRPMKLIDSQILRPAGFDPIEAGRKLQVQNQLAISLRVALGLNPTSNEDDAEDGFDTE